MNARELIQRYVKDQIAVENSLSDSDIQVDIIGNSQEAKAQVSYWIEGKMKMIEVTARDLGAIEK